MKLRAATMLIAAAAWMPAGTVLAGQAEIVAELQQQIVRCWAIPANSAAQSEAVTLTFKLGRDGSVEGMPTIVENPDDLEYSKDLVTSATRAILACQPYRLPADQYDRWKVIKITFRTPGT